MNEITRSYRYHIIRNILFARDKVCGIIRLINTGFMSPQFDSRFCRILDIGIKKCGKEVNLAITLNYLR
jgi:hypothetical protein